MTARSAGSAGLASRPVAYPVLAVVAGMGMLTAGAWLSVPFYPVPMTMQTLAVLVVGGLFGPRLGAAAVAGYLGLGLAGAPVFHGGLGGPLVFAGPTGGYLVGFLAAAVAMGLAAGAARGRARGRAAAAWRLVVLAGGVIIGETLIYLCGVSWLALSSGLGLERAVATGVVPFLLGDLLKAIVAVGAIRGGRRLVFGEEPGPF